jgi:hypothetical protein
MWKNVCGEVFYFFTVVPKGIYLLSPVSYLFKTLSVGLDSVFRSAPRLPAAYGRETYCKGQFSHGIEIILKCGEHFCPTTLHAVISFGCNLNYSQLLDSCQQNR